MSTSESPTLEMGPGDRPPHSPAPALLEGTVIADRYRVLTPLGRGGMGEVYVAEDRKLGQVVALKILPAELRDDPSRRHRLLAEVRLARSISHPNVVRVYDVGEADGQLFLSMERVDGDDLASRLARGALAPPEALSIGRQIAFGLAAAHEAGVLHRDLKPANILVDGRGVARIADFGLAEAAPEIRGLRAREGTPRYMSPEQLAGRAASAASDVFALGLVLHEIFTAESARPQDATIVLSSRLAALEPAIAGVIRRCLDVDPTRRPASARSVAESLPTGPAGGAALAAAQHRADRIAAFRAELAELRQQGVLDLGEPALAAVAQHHDRLLRDLVESFDVDIDERGRRLSLGMRIVSLLGGLALSASVFFFFRRFWGLLATPAQVAGLVAAPVLALLLTGAIAARERARDLTTMAGFFTLAWLAIDISALAETFGIPPSSGGFLVCGLVGLLLGFGYRARWMFVLGLVGVGVFVASTPVLARGLAWSACFERGEGFILAGALILGWVRFIDERRYPDFGPLARGLGLLALIGPAIFLGMQPDTSLLPLPLDALAAAYQVAVFVGSAAAIAIGLRHGRREWIWCGSGLFVVMLFTELANWWWDALPRYLFFFLMSMVAVLVLLVLRRLRTLAARVSA